MTIKDDQEKQQPGPRTNQHLLVSSLGNPRLSRLGLGQQGSLINSPGQQALDQIRPTKESGLGLAISHKGVGLVELGLKEEVGITNLNIRHSRLGIKNGSTRGLGQHKPVEREGLIDVTKERIGRDGLERVSSAKRSLKTLASRARKEEDTDQVHSTDVLTDGTTFLGLMRTGMGEQRRSIIEGHK
ncbi:hypothetical protein PVK06_034674 [Gossypium arboreum]|uniref:Uncharacterized protein n=1 Tax=Gossypium arboreum TaxID=29729 RepID=A0ABR0NEV1_GOSAR|nr:hypothetical protein PVK06_034674 [Gossypium arboreum]